MEKNNYVNLLDFVNKSVVALEYFNIKYSIENVIDKLNNIKSYRKLFKKEVTRDKLLNINVNSNSKEIDIEFVYDKLRGIRFIKAVGRPSVFKLEYQDLVTQKETKEEFSFLYDHIYDDILDLFYQAENFQNIFGYTITDNRVDYNYQNTAILGDSTGEFSALLSIGHDFRLEVTIMENKTKTIAAINDKEAYNLLLNLDDSEVYKKLYESYDELNLGLYNSSEIIVKSKKEK